MGRKAGATTMLGKSPCDTCHRVLLCRYQQQCCQQYQYYVSQGYVRQGLSRTPSRERYLQLFKPHCEDA